MEIPEQALQELKEIHRKLTGEELTDKEVLEMGQNLFRLILAIYRPIPAGKLEEHLECYPELRRLIDESGSNP